MRFKGLFFGAFVLDKTVLELRRTRRQVAGHKQMMAQMAETRDKEQAVELPVVKKKQKATKCKGTTEHERGKYGQWQSAGIDKKRRNDSGDG